MNTYKVEIQEVLQKVIEVEANSSEEAVGIAKSLYKMDEVELDASDLKETTFYCYQY